MLEINNGSQNGEADAMIKGILLDYDGVMTAPTNADLPMERLAAMIGRSPDETIALCKPLWSGYLRGAVSEPTWWQTLEAETGVHIAPAQRNIWTPWEDLQPLPEMRDFVRELRDTGYPVGLLTNVTPTTEQDIREHGGYKGFSFAIRSCLEGFAKPDPKIYQRAMAHFSELAPGIAPHEVLFVDDRERSLVPARELGMQTILAESSIEPAQLIAEIRTRL